MTVQPKTKHNGLKSISVTCGVFDSDPGAVRVTVRESSVEVVRGESAALPCSFFTLMPLFRLSIIWTLTPLSDPDSPTQVSLCYVPGNLMCFLGSVSSAVYILY